MALPPPPFLEVCSSGALLYCKLISERDMLPRRATPCDCEHKPAALLVALALLLLSAVVADAAVRAHGSSADGVDGVDADLWARADKAEHLVVCATLQAVTQRVLGMLSAESASAARVECRSAALVLAVGLGKEVVDGPRASLRDLAADLAGQLLALVAWRTVTSRRAADSPERAAYGPLQQDDHTLGVDDDLRAAQTQH